MSLTRRRRQNNAVLGIAKAAGSYLRYDPTLKHMRSAYNYATTPTKNTAPAVPLRGRPSKRKRRKRKPRSKTARKIKHCQAQIKQLNQKTDASLGTMTYRRLSSTQSLSQNNQQNAVISEINGRSEIIAVLKKLKFFNPSNPGTLLTDVDGSDGTYSRDYLFKSITQKLQIRNNFIADVQVKVYYCTVKEDTGLTPVQAWAAGIPDGGNAGGVEQLANYPSDYSHFRDIWHSKVVLTTTLSPGQSANLSNTVKNVEYDPAVFQTQTDEYQRDIKSGCFMVVFQGTNSHTTSSPFPVGYGVAGLDLIQQTIHVVEYQAGTNIKYVHIQNDLPSLASGGFQSHQPKAENQTFSFV